jgi:hypothetical protein
MTSSGLSASRGRSISWLRSRLVEADEVEQGVRHRAWFARCGCRKYERLLTQGFALSV